MGMMAFHLLFPDEAAGECRTVVPVGISDLPRRTFVFMEAYCADPRCDCRRVMLNVVDAETHDQVATINYGFEPPQPPFDDEGQMFLDPLNLQTAMSPAFLQLTADMTYIPHIAAPFSREFACPTFGRPARGRRAARGSASAGR